jgi:hypothetical protein
VTICTSKLATKEKKLNNPLPDANVEVEDEKNIEIRHHMT